MFYGVKNRLKVTGGSSAEKNIWSKDSKIKEGGENYVVGNKIPVFWDLTQRSLLNRHHRFGGTCLPHLQDIRFIILIL
jgi:hypothetical protein